jgi:hypothetical protein
MKTTNISTAEPAYLFITATLYNSTSCFWHPSVWSKTTIDLALYSIWVNECSICMNWVFRLKWRKSFWTRTGIGLRETIFWFCCRDISCFHWSSPCTIRMWWR